MRDLYRQKEETNWTTALSLLFFIAETTTTLPVLQSKRERRNLVLHMLK